MRYYEGGRAQHAPVGGSGVIVTPQGHVLTNYHVVKNTTRVVCTLPTGERIETTVLAHDPLTDLSVLKLRTEKRANPKAPLPYAKLGDSDRLQSGDPVLAMGNPLMLSSSVTLGIVSNPRRVFTDFTSTQLEEMELDSGERTGMFTRWIQHDALILPGNSGGPLVNLRGEVVGINELGGAGLGFAIPSNIAKQLLHQVLTYGSVRRGWLGCSILPVEKLGRQTGALIASVVPNSPAEKAGLAPGDILLAIDKKPVNARFFEEVPLVYQRIAALPVGKKVPIRFLRQGQERTVMAVVGLMERSVGEEEEFRELGVTVQELTAHLARIRHLPTKAGVLVTGLRPGYPFENAQPQISVGDLIVAVQGQPTPNLAAFRKTLQNMQGEEEILITYWRQEEQLLTVVKRHKEESSESGGELPKPWLGIKTQVLTPEVAKALKIPEAKGFRITEVYPWTEANKAGLKVGDVITALNGEPLEAYRPQDAEDLRRMIEEHSIGETVELSLLRNGKPMKVPLVLEEPPPSGDKAKKARQEEFEFTVREITMLDRMKHRWQKDQKGLLVIEVETGGWAHMAGLRLDDLILAINGQPVESVDSFQKRMAHLLQSKPKVITLFVRRGVQTHFVFIEPDWAKLKQTP